MSYYSHDILSTNLDNIISACEAISAFLDGVSISDYIESPEKRSAVERQLFAIRKSTTNIRDYDLLLSRYLTQGRIAEICNSLEDIRTTVDEQTARSCYYLAIHDIPNLNKKSVRVRWKLIQGLMSDNQTISEADSIYDNIKGMFGRKKWLIVLAAMLMYLLFVASPMKLSKDMERTAFSEVKKKQNELSHCGKETNSSINNGKSRKMPTLPSPPERNAIRAQAKLASRGTSETFFGVSNERDKTPTDTLQAGYLCDAFLQGITSQLTKANTEIQSRLSQEVEWFKLKYLYVGVMLLGFLINTYFKHNEQESSSVVTRFQAAVVSPVTSFILSLTVVVAISIDMQIRAGRIVINQLGTWIHSYVEPVLLGAGMGWEHFLRLEGGYHANTLYAMLFWTNIYYLTISLYVLYLAVTRKALADAHQSGKNDLSRIMMFGFWILHITIFVATLSNHIVPFTFRVTLFPVLTGWFPETYSHPAWLILVYMISWTILVFISYAYVNSKKSLTLIEEIR